MSWSTTLPIMARFQRSNLSIKGSSRFFHVLLKTCDELNIEDFQQFLKQWLRDVTTICDKLTKLTFAQDRNRFAVINVS